MQKRFMQSFFLQLIYKGIFQWFLKIFMGVQFSDNKFLNDEKQFIIIANHKSHMDTISLLASLPRKTIWKVKPVAAEDYFGKTKQQAAFCNYFINTLLIKRKITREEKDNPIKKMLQSLDKGYSLIIYPEGTRGSSNHMQDIKSGIARVLSVRPHIKYIPVYLVGMREVLAKHKLSVNYGNPVSVDSTDIAQIIEQIKSSFNSLQIQYQPAHQSED